MICLSIAETIVGRWLWSSPLREINGGTSPDALLRFLYSWPRECGSWKLELKLRTVIIVEANHVMRKRVRTDGSNSLIGRSESGADT